MESMEALSKQATVGACSSSLVCVRDVHNGPHSMDIDAEICCETPVPAGMQMQTLRRLLVRRGSKRCQRPHTFSLFRRKKSCTFFKDEETSSSRLREFVKTVVRY